MQSVKLMSMVIHNFRGIPHFELDTDGESCTISGANGTGKSTVQSAFLWMLTGKDAQGRENYNIFPLDESGARVTGSEPTVRAVLQIDGTELLVQRVLSEKWVKKRGKADADYSGDETKYWLDDVPVSATEFQARMDKLFPSGMLPLLLNSSYFSEQTKDYKERRRLLLENFGTITEADVLAQHPELDQLAQAAGNHSVEETTKIYTERRKKYRDELQTIPARIDECRKAIPEDLPDAQALEKQRSTLGVELAKLQYERSHTTVARTIADLEAQRADVNRKLQAIPAKLEGIKASAAGDWHRRHNEAYRAAEKEYRDAHTVTTQAKAELSRAEMELDAVQEKIDRLRHQWAKVSAEEHEKMDVCPTCHRTIPAEMALEAAKAFNQEKSRRLEKLATDGKSAVAESRRISKEVEKLQIAVEKAESAENAIADRMNALYSEVPPEPPIGIVRALEDERQELENKVSEIAQQIADAQATHNKATEELDAKIASLEAQRTEAERGLARVEQAKQTENRIAELEAERRQAMEGLDNAERILDLCRQYTQAMIEGLTDSINEHFRTVRFRLFEEQKNGGLREICEASVDGVPYGALNTAAKMQANIEIVDAFAQACGVSLPVFLDNRESVTTLDLPEDMQIINLAVDSSAKRLEVKGV